MNKEDKVALIIGIPISILCLIIISLINCYEANQRANNCKNNGGKVLTNELNQYKGCIYE